MTDPGAYFTEAKLAETVARDVLAGRFRCWKLDRAQWLEWDGRRWDLCPENAAVEAVRQWVIDSRDAAYDEMRKGQGDADLIKKWQSLLSRAKLNNIVALARAIDGVATPPNAFDRHPHLLNCGNGVVDLRTGALTAHDPALLITKMTPVNYVQNANHPDWAKALEALPEDVRDWYQYRMGQAATGHPPPDDVLLVQQGGGENGKSTIGIGVAKALGDYYTLVSERVLLASPDAHPTELMDLRGARFALIEETPEERRLSVARLKKAVGTPQLTARRIARDPVTWDSSHTLVVSTNYQPLITETDHGTWRRLALVSFPYRFRKPSEPLEHEHDRPGDPGLRGRLQHGTEQLEAVLAWLVGGARVFYAALDHGLPVPLPPRVEGDTRAWRREADVIAGFIDEHMAFDPAAHVAAVDLLRVFTDHLQGRHHKEWSAPVFASRFAGHPDVVAHRVEQTRDRADLGSRGQVTDCACRCPPGTAHGTESGSSGSPA